MPIHAFLTYLTLEKKYSAHTCNAYQRDLNEFSAFCKDEFDTVIINVSYTEIRHWIVSLVNKGISNRSINRKISSLKSFYTFLIKTEVIHVHPLAKHSSLKTQKRIQIPFSEKEIEQVMKLLNEEDDNFESVRNRLIVDLLYSTGMRRAELINLQLSDVNKATKNIKILGKRNKERIIPLLPSVEKRISDYLLFRSEISTNCSNLLITQKGAKVYPSLVYSVINSYFSAVSSKIKKSPHMIRHSFATHLLNEGADLNSVKELLGHASLSSTQIYTHSSLSKLKEVYNRAHPRSKK